MRSGNRNVDTDGIAEVSTLQRLGRCLLDAVLADVVPWIFRNVHIHEHETMAAPFLNYNVRVLVGENT